MLELVEFIWIRWLLIQVLVTDNGEPALSSSTRVVVAVTDVNDNAPEFLERFYKVQIPSTRVADGQLELALAQVPAIFFIFPIVAFSLSLSVRFYRVLPRFTGFDWV